MKQFILLAGFLLTAALTLPAEELSSVPDSQPAVPDTQAAVADKPCAPDTVFIFKDSALNHMMGRLKGFNEKIEKSRRQGYGGAGGWTPAFMAVDMKPVRDLALTDPALRGISFDIGRAGLMTGSGGLGYGGIGNGVRIGGYGLGGSRSYQSASIAGDSLARLNVDVSYGGFMVEKAFVRGRYNYFIGGMAGGGSYDVTLQKYAADEPSAFALSDNGKRGLDDANADFMVFGLHGGFTYSFVSWFHAGADAGLLGGYSNEGFGKATGSFFMGAGAVRLRLIWGNLG